MKKIVVDSVIALFILVAIALGYYYSQNFSVIPSDPLTALPSDAVFFLEAANGKEATTVLLTQGFFSDLEKDSSIRSIRRTLTSIDSAVDLNSYTRKIWTNQKVIISIHSTSASQMDLLWLFNLPLRTSEHQFFKAMETGFNTSSETRIYEGITIHEVRKENHTVLTYAADHGIAMISTTPFLVEAAIRQIKTGITFKKSKAFQRLSSASTSRMNLYINSTALQQVIESYVDSDHPVFSSALRKICRWTKLNINLANRSIYFDGVSTVSDSSQLVNAFSSSNSIVDKLELILPSRTAMVLKIQDENIQLVYNFMQQHELYYTNRSARNKTLDSLHLGYKLDVDSTFFSWMKGTTAVIMTEPGSTHLDNNVYAAFSYINAKQAKEQLNRLQLKSDGSTQLYRGYEIGTINITNLLPLIFGQIYDHLNFTSYALVKGFVIFANEPSQLKNYIDDIAENRLLVNSENDKDLGLQGNLSFYFDFEKGENIIQSYFNNEIIRSLLVHDKMWSSLKKLTINLEKNGKLFHSNAQLNFVGDGTKENSLLWSVQLDTTFSGKLSLINDEPNDRYFISVADDANKLYFFDEAGRLIWEKQLNDELLSVVHPVDYYKNNGLQLVFNTSKQLYMIDLNGNDVGNFPLHLPATATNGCYLSDFDSLKNYQVHVACRNGRIYAYELSGKPVNEWNLSQLIYSINTNFQNTSFKGNDYLIFTGEGGELYTVDRYGKTNFIKSTINSSILISDDLLCSYSDHSIEFSLLENNSVANRVELSNPISSAAFTSDSMIAFTTIDSIFIYSIKGEFDHAYPHTFSNETVVVQCVNDRTKAALIDAQKKLFTLFQATGDLRAGFPLKGNSSFGLIDNEIRSRKKRLITTTTDGIIYLYSLY